MKNYIPATFLLTFIVVGALMGLYFLPPMSVGGKPLRKVDLLADIRPDVEEEVCDSDTIVLPPPVKPIFVDTCKTGITCIEDYSDSTMRGMKHFYEALSKVKTMKRPVRIAYFGDSFIEADIFTADLREMLQQEFGGCGVGYVPVTSSISGYRPTVRHTFGGWSSHSSNDSVGFDKIQQDISGHYFFPREGAYVQLKGQSKYASRLDTCEVSTFYFLNKGFAAVRSKVNNAAEGELHEEVGTGGVQAVSVRGRIGQVRWSVEHADSATFYGVAMDGKQGISFARRYAAFPLAFGAYGGRLGTPGEKQGEEAGAKQQRSHGYALPISDSSVGWAESFCTSFVPAGTSFVTQTLPPMIEPLPMVMRPRMVAPAYTVTLSSRMGWRGTPLTSTPSPSLGNDSAPRVTP